MTSPVCSGPIYTPVTTARGLRTKWTRQSQSKTIQMGKQKSRTLFDGDVLTLE